MEDYIRLSKKFQDIVDNSVVAAYVNHSIENEQSSFALECCRRVFEKEMTLLSESVQQNPRFSQNTRNLLRKYCEKGLSLDWNNEYDVERFNEQTAYAKKLLDRKAKENDIESP